jgi:GntR family transcriptional regulator
MFLKIDTNRSLPLFGQIMEGIRLAIATGRLKSGDRIPSIHDLAVENRINPNTVARAYMELERAGVIRVKRGFGHYVTEALNGDLADLERRGLLLGRVEEFLTSALELGFGPEEVKSAIDQHVENLHNKDTE